MWDFHPALQQIYISRMQGPRYANAGCWGAPDHREVSVPGPWACAGSLGAPDPSLGPGPVTPVAHTEAEKIRIAISEPDPKGKSPKLNYGLSLWAKMWCCPHQVWTMFHTWLETGFTTG